MIDDEEKLTFIAIEKSSEMKHEFLDGEIWVMAGGSEPLELGRMTRVPSAAQRRAVILRDRHCRFPGWDRPPAWGDVHHITHWPDGGRTDLCNLILLCRRHHTMCHARGGFGLAVEDGRPVFRRPDGSILEDRSERAPPLAV